MAYECRNNLMPSYEPKGADVWSLGIVLLNLLFHRCPWADPTLDDPDFYAFRRDPISFLETRFEGIGTEVATFLANRVFCDVEDLESSPETMRDDIALPSSVATTTPFTMRRGMPKNVRVTAGEFGKWATKLVRYMGEGSRRASISDSTRQIVHTIRQSPRMEAGRAFHSPPTRSPRHSMELQRPAFIDGSPSRKTKRLSVGLPNDLMEELEYADHSHQIPTIVTGLASATERSSPLTQSLMEAAEKLSVKDTGRDNQNVSETVASHLDGGSTATAQDSAAPDSELPEEPITGQGDEISSKERSRRRKRGARKGKGHHRDKAAGVEDGQSPSLAGSSGVDGNGPEGGEGRSPESPNLDIVDTSKTLQAYAREISQSTKPPLVTSASYTPGTARITATGRQHTVSTTALSTPVVAQPAPVSKSRFADKLKNAFANGNPELQAFAARAKERDMALTGVGERNPTASAPAKMQHNSSSFQHPSSQLSSFGSVASSTGSWSEDGAAGKHWASTSSRRVRVDKSKRQPDDGSVAGFNSSLGTAPAIAARTGRSGVPPRQQLSTRDQVGGGSSSPPPSRRSFSPISSMSTAEDFVSPGGLPNLGRSGRSQLQSIDETVYAPNPKDDALSDKLHESARAPAVNHVLPQHKAPSAANLPASQIIRDPKTPPVDVSTVVSPAKSEQVAVQNKPSEAPVTAPLASRAKIGKFFNKFSRS